MSTPRYEAHKMPHPMLPFIYHRRFSLTQRQKTPNWHENIELLQCTEGEGYVLCGAEQVPLTRDGLVVVNADTLHSIGTEGQLVYRCLIIDNSFFAANGVPIGSLYFQSRITDPAVCSLFDRIARAYERFSAEDYRTVLEIRTHVLCLVQALCRGFTTRRPDNPANEHVKRAMTYLRQNLSAPLTLDGVAEAVGISKYHLAHLFKLFTGKTLVQTLNMMRCIEARRCIEEGMSVGAAAASCGFENLSYFTRVYKKHLGMLPSEHVPK